VLEIGKFFHSKKPPIPQAETLEIYAFMEAADESKRRGGEPVEIEEVIAKAQPLAAKRLAELGVK
ncbi:MAG TPA: gfo/Idh/MocA family oxidoreductase, partial [Pirellulaceae bacterium]|nr:gfo/Idh/MocA family oxidoreductase [Pirellulaceae bacterium]